MSMARRVAVAPYSTVALGEGRRHSLPGSALSYHLWDALAQHTVADRAQVSPRRSLRLASLTPGAQAAPGESHDAVRAMESRRAALARCTFLCSSTVSLIPRNASPLPLLNMRQTGDDARVLTARRCSAAGHRAP